MAKKSTSYFFYTFYFSTIFLLSSVWGKAQTCPTAAFSGTYTIPSTCFPDIASAVSALNTYGVSGPVTFDVDAGYNETAPTGGYVLTATGTASNPIIFQKTGSGSNPTITAGLQVAASYNDAIFKLSGSDYITFEGFTLQENASNITATPASNTMTEFGFALYLATATNGAQNNTIRNCTISLNSTYVNSVGIFSTSRATIANAELAATSTAGTNSNNKIYSNTISNVAQGIYFICGGVTTSIFETGNDIGGTSAAMGNTITFGGPSGTTQSSLAWANNGTSLASGISFRNGVGNNIRFNTITSNVISYAQSAFAGIQMSNSSTGTPTGVTYTTTVSNNSITLTNNGTTGIVGIDFGYGITTGSIVANNNIISINSGSSTANSSTISGVRAGFTNSTSTISSNTISINHSGTGTWSGAVYFINADGGSATTTIQSNTLQSTGNNIKTTGTVYGISHNAAFTTSLTIGGSAATANTMNISSTGSASGFYGTYSISGTTASITNYIISYNNINVSGLTGSSSNINGIYNIDGGAPVKNFNNNTISFTGASATGTINGIYFGWSGSGTNVNNNAISISSGAANSYGVNTTANAIGTLSNNSVTISSSNASASVTAVGLNLTSSTGGPYVITNNTINSITSSSTGTNALALKGIANTIGTNNTISGNTIKDISTGASTGLVNIAGIEISGGTTPSIFNNNIYNLSTSSSGNNSMVSGISFQTAGTGAFTVYNNFISDLRMPNATATAGIGGIFGINGARTGQTYRIYYNTIKLGSTASPLSVQSNVRIVGVGFLSTAANNVDLRNNIININATANTGGFNSCVALTGVTPAVNTVSTVFATTSNNNIYYINPATNNYLYSEGGTLTALRNGYAISGLTANTPNNIVNDTAFNTSCGLYKSFMAGRETATFAENNLTAGSTIGTFAPTGTSFAENGAQTISSPSITTDFAGLGRTPTNDIGALQFNGTGVDAVGPTISYTNITTPQTSVCAVVTLSATITDVSGVNTTVGTAPRLWYKKSTNADALPATNDNTTDGWKYVEASNTSSPFNFTINYSLLNGGVSGGETIQYFVAAQDNAGSPNVSTISANYASGFCPASVALSAAAFPLANATGLRTYTITASGTAMAGATTVSPTTICNSGTTSVGFTPSSGTTNGFVYDVQSSPAGAGTWTTIAANATLPYAASVAAATDFQIVVKNCGGTTLFTSSVATVALNSATITGTTPGTRCGTGTVQLAATGSAGTTLNWYAAANGGTSLGSGDIFVTPSISATTSYYVSAYNPASGISGITGINSGSNTGTETVGAAFPSYWGNVRTQVLIRASELTAAGLIAGNITGMSINVTSLGNPTSLSGYTMKIASTSATEITTFQSPTFTTVYSSTYTPVTGVNTVLFSTPFNWDGTSNIIIEYCFGAGTAGTLSAINNYTTTSYNSFVNSTSDSSTTICTSTTVSNTIRTRRPNFTLIGNGKCESARTEVIATVTTATPVTINGTSSTICNGGSATLVTVTSAVENYDTYTWSQTTGTGALPTGNATSGWTFSPASTTTYTLTANNSVTGCSYTAVTYTATVLPASAAITANSTAFCGSGTPSLALNPSTGLGTATFQWQSSADGISYDDISGAQSATYTAATPITTTTYYKVVIKNSSGDNCLEPIIQIAVNNPEILTTTPGSRCGTGTVELAATGSGTALNWYTAATGGTPIATGNTFTTTSISATTNYWVEAVANSVGGDVFVGPISPVAQGGTIGTQTVGWDVNFNVIQSTTLKSVTIFPITSGQSGTLTVRIGSGFSGTVLTTINYTTTVGGGMTPQIIPINLVMGTGSYSIYTDSLPSSGIRRNISGASYPYTSSVANITGNGYDSTYYMGLYNWNFTSVCASPRTQVTATVNPAPALTLNTATTTTCGGSASDPVTITSGASSYTNYSWSPATGVSGSAATGWTFNPSASTTYTLTASNADLLDCVNTATVNVTVKPVPTAITLTPTIVTTGAGVCNQDYVRLDASGGSYESTILTEGFNAATNNWIATTTNDGPSRWTLRGFSYYYYDGYDNYFFDSSDSSQYYLSNSDAQSGSTSIPITTTLTSPSFSLLGLNQASITFNTFYFPFTGDHAYVDVQVNGGAWINVADYTTQIGTHYVFDYDPYWDEFYVDEIFEDRTIDLSSYAGNSDVKVRFRYQHTYDFWWAIDNVSITGMGRAITWSPTTGLYTDAALTTPYTGQNQTTVYAMPDGTVTYTATATNGTCTKDSAGQTVTNSSYKFFASNGIWNDEANWRPQVVPNIDKCVRIPADKMVTVNVNNAAAKSLSINQTGQLIIDEGQTLTVKEAISIPVNNVGNDNLVVKSDANLLQIDNAVNTGKVQALRKVKMKRMDYTYWSAPVFGQKLRDNAGDGFSVGTPNNRIYNYNEPNDLFYATSDDYFVSGKGYAIRGKASYTDVLTTGTFTNDELKFTGVPNNGISVNGQPLKVTVQKSKNTVINSVTYEHGYNLIGNPYPSNIDFVKFFNLGTNSNYINGKAWFWTNVTPHLNMEGSSYEGNNYATLTLAGGTPPTYAVGTAPSGALTPTKNIRLGQGFIVQVKDAMTTTSPTVSYDLFFDNTIRTNESGVFYNNPKTSDINRFWLRYISPDDMVNTVLLAYLPGSTTGYDGDYDAELFSIGNDSFYSVLDNKKLQIESRGNFDARDVVPMGTKSSRNGQFRIEIENPEGIFANGQAVYIKDRLLQTYTNLQNGPYVYDATTGLTEGRFEIVYLPETTLGTGEAQSNPITVYRDGDHFVVRSALTNVKEVEVYDMSGRLIQKVKGQQKQAIIPGDLLVNGAYVLKITTTDQVVSRKIRK